VGVWVWGCAHVCLCLCVSVCVCVCVWLCVSVWVGVCARVGSCWDALCAHTHMPHAHTPTRAHTHASLPPRRSLQGHLPRDRAGRRASSTTPDRRRQRRRTPRFRSRTGGRVHAARRHDDSLPSSARGRLPKASAQVHRRSTQARRCASPRPDSACLRRDVPRARRNLASDPRLQQLRSSRDRHLGGAGRGCARSGSRPRLRRWRRCRQSPGEGPRVCARARSSRFRRRISSYSAYESSEWVEGAGGRSTETATLHSLGHPSATVARALRSRPEFDDKVWLQKSGATRECSGSLDRHEAHYTTLQQLHTFSAQAQQRPLPTW